MDNNNYKSMQIQCYICDSPNHLALKCHKFTQKWKGNLMKIKFQSLKNNQRKEQNSNDYKEEVNYNNFNYVDENYDD